VLLLYRKYAGRNSCINSEIGKYSYVFRVESRQSGRVPEWRGIDYVTGSWEGAIGEKREMHRAEKTAKNLL